MKPNRLAIAGLVMLPISACDSEVPPATPGVRPPSSVPVASSPAATAPTQAAAPSPAPAPVAAASRKTAPPFLDQTKEVDPGREWLREVSSRKGGAMAFRVESQGKFAVSVVTDTGLKAIQGGSGPTQQDLLMTADSKGNSYEGKVTLPVGSSWFIIENRTGQKVNLRLVCSEG